jgi:hypothetical protein
MRLKFNLILSSIPRNYGGAGAYLDKIVDDVRYSLHLYPINFNINYIFLNRLLLAMQVVLIRLFARVIGDLKLLNEILVYHPQTIGYKLCSRLISNSNKCVYYVLDSSFFCKKSYNEHNNKNCLKCLNDFTPFDSCNSFPFEYKDSEYTFFLKTIQENITKIEFIVQHKGIEVLLKQKYSKDCNVTIKKMVTNEFSLLKRIISLKYDIKYDFVFHGHKLNAKGYDYSIQLAKKLKELSFFFPIEESTNNLSNATFISQNWESGLMQTIQESFIVLVPSIWTAPVESALIKSMLLGKPVCVFRFENSTAENLLPLGTYIPLTGDIESDSKLLRLMLRDVSNLQQIGERGKEWANKYIEFEN